MVMLLLTLLHLFKTLAILEGCTLFHSFFLVWIVNGISTECFSEDTCVV